MSLLAVCLQPNEAPRAPRRQRHGFATAPNSRILRTLLSMASSPCAAAAAALEAAVSLAEQARSTSAGAQP
jgi:hypothetical protein